MFIRKENILVQVLSGLCKLQLAFKLVAVVCAAFIAGSCHKEDPLSQGTFPVKIFTDAAPANQLTKATLDGLNVKWSASDKLAVIAIADDETASGELDLLSGEGSSSGTFEGEVVMARSIPASCCFTYLAPANGGGCAVAVNVQSGEIDFSYDNQTGDHNPFLLSRNVSYSSSGINATLEHIGGVLAVTLPDGIAKITVQGNRGEKLSGYRYNYRTGSGVVDGGEYFSIVAKGAGVHYINMPPVKFDKGFSLLLEGPDGKTMYKSFNYSGGCDFSVAPAQGQAASAAALKGALVELSVDSFEPYGLTSSDLSWSHTYDGAGALTGTQVNVGGVAMSGAPNSLVKSYVAELKNSAGTVVRRYNAVSIPAGSHTLPVANGWPYLPQGNYTLELTVETLYGKTMFSRTLAVGQPKLTATVSAVTSYSYYTGDGVTKSVDEANKCDNSTIYNISTEIKISSEILKNGNYAKPDLKSFKLDDGNYAEAMDKRTISGNAYKFTSSKNATGQSWASHNFVASIIFDGVTVEASKKVEITGLPFKSVPPTDEDWNRSGSGNWEGDHARLGSWTSGEASITSKKFNIIGSINVLVGTKYQAYGATIGTTFTMYAGSNVLFSTTVKNLSWGKYDRQTVEGTKDDVVLTGANNYIRCVNSYSAGDTHSKVYYVNVYYR